MEFRAYCYCKRHKGKNKGKIVKLDYVYFDGSSVIADMKMQVTIKPPYKVIVDISGSGETSKSMFKYIFIEK